MRPYSERMSPRIKLADVAAKAGVSVSAVSLVMNGKDAGNIAPRTRARILAAANELDYRPNSVAQSLRRNRSHALGLVTDSIASSPFAGRIVAGAMDIAAARGYVLLLLDTGGQSDREEGGIAELARRQVDGLLYATMGHARLVRLPQTRLPLVLVNCSAPPADSRSVPTVIPDDVTGGRAAAEHLLGLGHRRIVMLSGPPPGPDAPEGNISGPLREDGFREALTVAGDADLQGAVRVVGWDINDGYRGAMAVLADERGSVRPPAHRPTALFAINDRAASGAVHAAAALGIRVPQELSIVGFDDQERFADRLTPPLTTLALPHRAMGEAGTTLLLDLLAGHPAPDPTTCLLPCPLIERASTAPPSV